MNETPNYNQSINQPTMPGQVTPVAKPPIFGSVKDLFTRFYANKKIFWPITGSVAVILLVIIVGLIFGKKSPMQVITKPTTIPSQSQAGPTASPSTDQLSQIQINLGQIKDQITNLDIIQAPLQPPAIDFKISF